MGRHFAQYNAADPKPVVALLEKCPPCFEPKQWRVWLLDVHRGTLNDEAERARLNRGETPPYCDACTVGYANKMKAQGRCSPPERPIPGFGVVEESCMRHEGAARAAPEPSGRRRGLDVKVTPTGAIPQPQPGGNARTGFASPRAGLTWLSGLCAESGAA